jgi:hypothetical protein
LLILSHQPQDKVVRVKKSTSSLVLFLSFQQSLRKRPIVVIGPRIFMGGIRVRSFQTDPIRQMAVKLLALAMKL